MTEISRELNLIVSLLSLRFPVAELNTTTGYSKGTISNYLSGKQGASKKFLRKVFETFDNDFQTFEFKKRFSEAVEHYTDVNNIDIHEFARSIGWDINSDYSIESILEENNEVLLSTIKKISSYIPDFISYINNESRADIKTLSVKKLTKLERTLFLKKDELSESEMILFVKVIRKHRESLLSYSLFQKLIRSLAYSLEIDQEIKDALD